MYVIDNCILIGSELHFVYNKTPYKIGVFYRIKILLFNKGRL